MRWMRNSLFCISSFWFLPTLLFQVVAGISVFFICTSVISFCLKTLPGLRVEIPLPMSSNSSDIYQASTTLPPSITEANFITTTSTQRPHGGLFNRYSVIGNCWRNKFQNFWLRRRHTFTAVALPANEQFCKHLTSMATRPDLFPISELGSHYAPWWH